MKNLFGKLPKEFHDYLQFKKACDDFCSEKQWTEQRYYKDPINHWIECNYKEYIGCRFEGYPKCLKVCQYYGIYGLRFEIQVVYRDEGESRTICNFDTLEECFDYLRDFAKCSGGDFVFASWADL